LILFVATLALGSLPKQGYARIALKKHNQNPWLSDSEIFEKPELAVL
jgi:hypothetical protein